MVQFHIEIPPLEKITVIPNIAFEYYENHNVL